MGSLVMIFYLLFLVLALVYFIRIIYRNYRKGRSFQDGQNRIVSNIILLCIVIGQFLIPSTNDRIIVFLLFTVALLLLYIIIGFHNRTNHSGDLFLFYQGEIRKEKTFVGIGIGLLLIALFLINFMD